MRLRVSGTWIIVTSDFVAKDLLFYRCNDLADRALRFVVRHPAGADDFVTAAAVMPEQLADVHIRCRVENIVAHRDGGSVFPLRIFGDFDRNVTGRKKRVEQETVAFGYIFDAA